MDIFNVTVKLVGNRKRGFMNDNSQVNTKTDISLLICKDIKRGMTRISYDKRFASMLRRGAGRTPEQEPDAFAAVCANLDDEFIKMGHKEITVPQKAEYIALTLFAEAGAKEGSAYNDKQDKQPQSFAKAMGRLSKTPDASEQGMIDTFRRILQARSVKEMLPHLYGAVTILESKHIVFDYAQLASDFLFGLLSSKSKDKAVIRAWEDFERGRRTMGEKGTDE